MPNLAEKLAQIASTSDAQAVAMQRLLADVRAADIEITAGDLSADHDKTAGALPREEAERG